MTRRRVSSVLALAAMLLLAGMPPAGAVDETARNLLPEEMRQKGTLIAGLPLDFEPFNYLDDKNEQVGLDVEVFRAVADVLGLKPEILRLGLASVIPAVSGGRVDIGMMGITEPRLKQVTFVRYTLLANGLIVRKGNPAGLSNVSACGHSIAVEKGSQPVMVWEKKAKECEATGKPKMELLVFDGKGPQVLAVEAGRADAAGVTLATAVVAAKHSNGKLDAAPGGPVPDASIDGGIALKKENKQLAQAIEAALKVIHANGTYDRIFAKWGLSDTAASPAIFE
jgi:polar amino acid transport system substrate-binding protein